MSRKNNLQKRRVAREAELAKDRAQKLKQARKTEMKLSAGRAKPDSGTRMATDDAPERVVGPSKFKGIRLKRNLRVRGIKIKDAESKRKVKEMLLTEQKMRGMNVEDDGAAAPTSGSKSKPSRKDRQAAKVSAPKPAAMAID